MLRKSRFITVEGIADLVQFLFGYWAGDEVQLLHSAMSEPPHCEFQERQLGRAAATGRWIGGPAVLWATLFLEHRRWRSGSPATPDAETELMHDRLCRQLATNLELASETTP